MRFFVIVCTVALGVHARADVPSGVAERLSHFALDGCDYLKQHSLKPFKPEPPPKKLAAHFGRITRTQKRGIAVEYVLKAPSFDEWEVSYWERGVDMKVPASVAITLGDLQSYFGRDKDVDVDYAMATATGEASEREERMFEPPGHGVCWIFVEVQTDRKLGPSRRVFTLRFQN